MIRTNVSPAGQVDVDEFYDRVEDGQKADLIDGEIYMASPDSLDADDVCGFIRGLLWSFVEARRLGGRVCGSRVAFILDRFIAPEPDIAYLRPERLAEQTGKRVHGPPDLAIEICCDESRVRDQEIKKAKYEAAGVREYWIVDRERGVVQFYVLRDGRFEPLELEDGQVYRSTVLPGFWLDARWLAASPLPNGYDCQRLILGE
jgi:Uma2 family endonuclease